MVNGYVTLDLASNNIYSESIKAKASGKPILVVDAPNVYFADTIKTATIDDDVVVEITKGGKTITINDANAVSSEGDIQAHLYNTLINLGDFYINIALPFKITKFAIDNNDVVDTETYNDIAKILEYYKHAYVPLMCNDFYDIITYYGLFDEDSSYIMFQINYYSDGSDKTKNVKINKTTKVATIDDDLTLSVEKIYQLF